LPAAFRGNPQLSIGHQGTRPLVAEQGENAPNGKLPAALGQVGGHLQPIRFGPKGKGKGPSGPGPTPGRGTPKGGTDPKGSTYHRICGVQRPERGGIRNNTTSAIPGKFLHPLGH